MSKVLVAVYSRTGTSSTLARLLCSQQGWTLGAIAEEHPRSGAAGYARCLIDSLLRRRPVIRYTGPPPKEFDAVVLVSPIWGYRMASPMRSFVARRQDHLPDVAVVSVMGGSGEANALAEITQLIGRAPIQHAAFTQREVEDGSYAGRLQAFGKAIGSAEDSKQVVRPVVLSPQVV